MNRILHRITAIIGGLAFSMMFMLAGLDTVSMPDWAYLSVRLRTPAIAGSFFIGALSAAFSHGISPVTIRYEYE